MLDSIARREETLRGTDVCASVSPSIKSRVLVREAVVNTTREHQNPASQRNCEIVVATTLDEVAKLRDDWLFLRSRYGKPTLFSDPEFFLKVCSALDDDAKPRVAVLRDGGQPFALIIGRLHRQSVLCAKSFGFRRLKLRSWTIFFDGLVTDEETRSKTSLATYLDHQLRSGDVDLLNLQHLDLTDKTTGAVVRHLEARFRVVRQPELHLYRELIDPDSGIRVGTNSTKTRATLRRKDRRLVEHFGGSVDLQIFNAPSEVSEFIDEAAAIVCQTYQATLGTGVQRNHHWQTVVGALASIASFKGYLLRATGIPIAYVLGAVYDDRFILFATGYVPTYKRLSPGTVLMNRVFASLVADGVRTVDFGFGDAEYKRLHSTRIEEELSLRVYGIGYRATIGWLVGSSTSAGRHIARRVLRRTGLGMVAKRYWRRYLVKRGQRSAEK